MGLHVTIYTWVRKRYLSELQPGKFSDHFQLILLRLAALIFLTGHQKPAVGPHVTFSHALNVVISVTGYSQVSAVERCWSFVLLLCSHKLYDNCYTT
jgi:hypothetical protein